MKLRSGATIRRLTREQAAAKNYLTRETLAQMHLIPGGEPVAYFCAESDAEHKAYYCQPDPGGIHRTIP